MYKQPINLQDKRSSDLDTALRNTDDPTFAIILSHLYSEQLIDEILELVLTKPKKLIEEGRLGFKQKILLVHALGKVDPKALAFLKVLNKLRNNAAHSLNYRPSEEEVFELVGTTGLNLARFGKEIPIEQLLPFGIHLVMGRLGAITDIIRAESDGNLDEWIPQQPEDKNA